MKGKSLITLLCVLGIGCLGIVGCTAPKNSNDVATKEEIIEQNSTTEVKCSNGIFKGTCRGRG